MAENKMSGAITKATGTVAKAQPKTMKDFVQSMSTEIAKALPSVITPERFTRMTLTAISNNPQLAECTPKSFLGAMMSAAQLGVEPNTPLGQSYLIPYRNKGVLECQFQLGYKGLLDLAWRSGEITSIYAETVYENDEFSYELGLNPDLKHVPARENRGNPIFFYAVFVTKSGGKGFRVMSVEDVRAHAKKYSKASNSSYSPWNTDFEGMSKKTVLKALLKFAPLKTEFHRGLAADSTIKTELSEDMSMVKDETDYIDVEAEEAPQAGENTAEKPSEAE